MKTDKKKTIQKLMEMMPDYTETAFTVKHQADDSGKYISVYVERTEEGEMLCKKIPTPFEGWRVLHISCPDGYIKNILERHRE